MTILKTLEEINVIVPSGQLNKKLQLILDKHPDVLDEVLRLTEFIEDETLRTKITVLRKGITQRGKCLSCSANTSFNHKTGEYNSFCANTKGNSCGLKTEDVRSRMKQTTLDRHGVDHIAKLPETTEKRKSTMLKRYGVEHPMHCDTMASKAKTNKTVSVAESNDKRAETMIGRYGASTWMASQICPDVRDKLDDKEYLQMMLNEYTTAELAELLDVSISTIQNRIKQFNIALPVRKESKYERLVRQWLEEFGVVFEQNNYSILETHELDFYLKEHDLAIEINGVYFHSELMGRDKMYHLTKTLNCNAKGVRLIQILHTELDSSPNIVRARIQHALRLSVDRIYARKCKIVKLTSKEANKFLNEHHIQGGGKSSIRYGLMYQDNIVAVMTFVKSRYNKNIEYELLRYATKHAVVGGASKLLSHFISQHNPKSIVSYCDLRWGTGNLYEQLGFTLVKQPIAPNYHYFHKNNANVLFSRIQFQKHKLKDLLEHFNPTMTEWENMQMNGYDRIWDCGSSVYVMHMDA